MGGASTSVAGGALEGSAALPTDGAASEWAGPGSHPCAPPPVFHPERACTADDGQPCTQHERADGGRPAEPSCRGGDRQARDLRGRRRGVLSVDPGNRARVRAFGVRTSDDGRVRGRRWTLDRGDALGPSRKRLARHPQDDFGKRRRHRRQLARLERQGHLLRRGEAPVRRAIEAAHGDLVERARDTGRYLARARDPILEDPRDDRRLVVGLKQPLHRQDFPQDDGRAVHVAPARDAIASQLLRGHVRDLAFDLPVPRGLGRAEGLRDPEVEHPRDPVASDEDVLRRHVAVHEVHRLSPLVGGLVRCVKAVQHAVGAVASVVGAVVACGVVACSLVLDTQGLTGGAADASPDGGGCADASRSYRDAVMCDRPAAYWRFGEAAGSVAADEMGQHAGAYLGGVALGVPGAIAGDGNTAAHFDGATGYVSFGNVFGFEGSPFSVEAWVESDISTGWPVILGKETRTSDGVEQSGYTLYLNFVDQGLNAGFDLDNGARSVATWASPERHFATGAPFAHVRGYLGWRDGVDLRERRGSKRQRPPSRVGFGGLQRRDRQRRRIDGLLRRRDRRGGRLRLRAVVRSSFFALPYRPWRLTRRSPPGSGGCGVLHRARRGGPRAA